MDFLCIVKVRTMYSFRVSIGMYEVIASKRNNYLQA